MKPDIEIHIDELVLQGFSTRDFTAIGQAVESELTRLFSEQGALHSISSPKKYVRIDAGEFAISSGAKSHAVGNNIAASVFKGIKNSRSLPKK
jgi:hypothetical protein